MCVVGMQHAALDCSVRHGCKLARAFARDLDSHRPGIRIAAAVGNIVLRGDNCFLHVVCDHTTEELSLR